MEETMFIDPQRCIGCRACVAACRECATHKGYSMIFVDYLDRSETTATMPTIKRISPVVLTLKPVVVTLMAKSRIAPITARTIPNAMSPVPAPLFIVPPSGATFRACPAARPTKLGPAHAPLENIAPRRPALHRAPHTFLRR